MGARHWELQESPSVKPRAEVTVLQHQVRHVARPTRATQLLTPYVCAGSVKVPPSLGHPGGFRMDFPGTGRPGAASSPALCKFFCKTSPRGSGWVLNVSKQLKAALALVSVHFCSRIGDSFLGERLHDCTAKICENRLH